MSEHGSSHFGASSASSKRSGAAQVQTPVSGTTKSLSDPPEDIAAVHKIYYPCFGNVDLKSYTDARMYGLSFRRLHDEWVVLGRPHIDASHWPRMVGHQGLPTLMEDLTRVADYYDRKIFAQVLLDVQRKSANRDRPLDDFIVSMVTAAAVINADLMVYRLVRDQPAVEQATTQSTWHHHFSTFMHDSIRHFCNERKVCDRLGTHHCAIPLMFGQTYSMSLPTLLQNFDYQVQVFQNLFPNFGEHINRCAAAAAAAQTWKPTSGVPSAYSSSTDSSSQRAAGQNLATQGLAHASGSRPGQHSTYRDAVQDHNSTIGDDDQEAELESSRKLTVAIIPEEVKERNDLFSAQIDSAIRCDVPLEKVVALLDSRLSISTSSSVSTASTPLSMTTSTPVHGTQQSSLVSSRTAASSSDADWPTRRRGEASDLSTDESGADIESTNLTLRPPLHSHASWSSGIQGRATSEEHSMITPEEGMAISSGRSHRNSAYSYFSSLPSTPTDLLSPDTLIPGQEGSQAYTDRRSFRSSTGALPLTSSTSDAESRKRTRAEQNREKMKAYHRRVMQQRETLTSVLSDMSAHVGAIPMASMRGRAGSLLGSDTGEGTSSIGRSAQEPSWSASLRNKQKQESKARLRKREIDQVHEFGLYASYATATLARSSAGAGSSSSGSDGYRNEEGGSATPWRQLHAHQVAEADIYMSQAIARVFLRHRPNWIALISAEQRLAGEVAKLSPKTEEGRSAHGRGGEGEVGSDALAGKGIKALIDRIQMEERTGILATPVGESTPMIPRLSIYDHQNQLARGSGGMGSPRSVMGVIGVDTSRLTPGQPFSLASGHGQIGFMEAGPMVLSPGTTEYAGSTASPSGVTRAMDGDEGADYFAQGRRRYGGRDSGSGDTEASAIPIATATGYNTEQGGSQFGRAVPQSQGHRSANFAPGMSPSVLSPGPGYGQNPFHTAGGAQQQQQQQ